ncbi:hypothetical protein WJX75_001180 [Coccomyxa subellipsoidea]|uniref:Uncharacterized protein n=1 Tax=Coccomyxa subellipsoidea TaxID=248742 RepID=A0ABR2YFW6_9CHLO
MSLGRFLVEKHTRIAAVVFPVSVLGGLAYTMKTGASPLADGKDWVQGKDPQHNMYTLNFKLGGIGSK